MRIVLFLLISIGIFNPEDMEIDGFKRVKPNISSSQMEKYRRKFTEKEYLQDWGMANSEYYIYGIVDFDNRQVWMLEEKLSNSKTWIFICTNNNESMTDKLFVKAEGESSFFINNDGIIEVADFINQSRKKAIKKIKSYQISNSGKFEFGQMTESEMSDVMDF
jgi:hypothetical protein